MRRNALLALIPLSVPAFVWLAFELTAERCDPLIEELFRNSISAEVDPDGASNPVLASANKTLARIDSRLDLSRLETARRERFCAAAQRLARERAWPDYGACLKGTFGDNCVRRILECRVGASRYWVLLGHTGVPVTPGPVELRLVLLDV